MDTSTPLILKSMSPEGQDVAVRLIKEWHASLQTQRGWRAELRRADSPAALLLCTGFRELARPFRSWLAGHEWRWLGLALAAGVASHVKQINEQNSFAAQLGKPVRGSGNPPLSALRFSRLNQAHDHDELYRLLIRAVRQLDGKANLPSMVDGILLWCREQDEIACCAPFERSPFQRPALRWATEYFQATEMTEE